ncbi:MAG: thioredoxin family protein [Planctomycetota bacterium]|jgi:thiol-disulfide isomerase/thioredoxin
MTRILLLSLAIVAASTLHAEANNEGSVYTALVEIQAVDTLPRTPVIDREESQRPRGSEEAGGHRALRPRHQDGGAYDGLTTFEAAATARPSQEPILVESGEFTLTKPRGFRSRGYKFDIPVVEDDELPFIDAAGDTDRNYAVLISAEWCLPCKTMYKTIAQLREEGYRVYVMDVDAFPEIKDKLNRLANNPQAPQIGLGVPWLVIRESGKTVKVFKGVTDIETIRPFLTLYQDQLDRERDKDGETDYNFVDEADRP